MLAKAYLARCLSSPDSRKTARDWGASAQDIREELSSDIGHLRDPSDSDDGRFMVQTTARNLLTWGGYDVQSRQPIDGDFLRLVRRMLIALRTIELQRLDEDFSDDPRDADLTNFKSASLSLGKARSQQLTVARAIETLWKEQIEPENKAAKTVIKYHASFNLLARYLGKDRPINEVTREDLVSYRDALMRMPSNYSKRFGEDRSFPEILAASSNEKTPLMKYKTRENYIFMMKRLFRWAAVNDYIRKDLSAGIPVGGKDVAGRSKRRPFKVSELNSIFQAPIFTGCVDDGRNYAKIGYNKPRRSRYWVPIIALYSGMRMGEILQLRVEHVRQSPMGHSFFFLTDGFGEEDGDKDFMAMQLKTFNSRREVPIHPVLIHMGFLDFVDSIKRERAGELFPEVPSAADGKKSTIFSKWFSRFLRKAGVKPDGSGNCFHMFRHTMRDAIRNCQIPEEVADAVQGWAREDDVGRNYGSGFEVDAIADVWQRLRYQGLDIDHLLLTGKGEQSVALPLIADRGPIQ